MTAYYNENDDFAAAWLRELIKENLIAPGEVDERSICDVTGADLSGFTQVHLFAGIGGWSYALRLAGWPDNRPVGTGSCPCQPFSAAGKQCGTDDKRHLWPDMLRLVSESDIATWFGEQVASRLGREWLAGVRTDMEALGYGVGCADLCAAGVVAPHIRQRLYWMADANGGIASDGDVQRSREHGQRTQDSRIGDGFADSEYTEWRPEHQADSNAYGRDGFGGCGDLGGMGDADAARSQGRREHVGEHSDQRAPWASSQPEWLADPMPTGRPERGAGAGERSSPWRGVLIPCADGRLRRVPANEAGESESSLFPLAYGVHNRVGTLRGAGNAIVPPLAAAFIRACF